LTAEAPAAAPAARQRELLDVLRALDAWTSERGWAGTDPYDGLNATRLATPLHRSAIGRRLLTQIVKRSPIDLRPPLGIKPVPSAAALAHFASSYAIGQFLAPEVAAAKLERSLHAMLELRCESHSGLAFGYPFDVQTRVFFYPRGAPNTIATAFAGGALLDAYAATGEERWLGHAEDVGAFFVDEVPQTSARGGAFFGYLVGDRTPIHNANLLVCALLARLGAVLSRADLVDRATEGVAYTLAHQREDGSWPYGEGASLGWVDNFHTGYVLESLLRCAGAGIELDHGCLDRGLRYYRDSLFLADGTPRYTPDSIYPVDIQCVAQGIQTFSLAAGSRPEYEAAAGIAFGYGVRRMRRRDGAFAFQRRRLWANRTPHMRWCEAPMQHALAHLSQVQPAAR
jgi:hypothetical protein